MTSRDFCYWLMGYFEITKDRANNGLTPLQTEMIQKHLSLVFAREINPSQGDAQHQAHLSAIHHGKPNEPFDPHSTLIQC